MRLDHLCEESGERMPWYAAVQMRRSARATSSTRCSFGSREMSLLMSRKITVLASS